VLTAVNQLNPCPPESSDFDDEDDEEHQEPVTKKILSNADYISGFLDSYLDVYCKEIKACDGMINDEGKPYMLALLKFIGAFHADMRV
jgi:hypothetical protein